jgi:hypothetical protein
MLTAANTVLTEACRALLGNLVNFISANADFFGLPIRRLDGDLVFNAL